MTYTCSIEIDLPIDKVVGLWTDESHFQDWQDGFKSIELIYGKKHEVGSKSKLVFEGKRQIELVETILISNLPQEKKAIYEHKYMINTQRTLFQSINEHKTRFISEVNYIKFNGLFIKIIAKLFPSKFKAQSQKWMEQFKYFTENLEK
ncbi:MAG: SRPBCC family protein [Flavobacteriales bacterium]